PCGEAVPRALAAPSRGLFTRQRGRRRDRRGREPLRRRGRGRRERGPYRGVRLRRQRRARPRRHAMTTPVSIPTGMLVPDMRLVLGSGAHVVMEQVPSWPDRRVYLVKGDPHGCRYVLKVAAVEHPKGRTSIRDAVIRHGIIDSLGVSIV